MNFSVNFFDMWLVEIFFGKILNSLFFSKFVRKHTDSRDLWAAFGWAPLYYHWRESNVRPLSRAPRSVHTPCSSPCARRKRGGDISTNPNRPAGSFRPPIRFFPARRAIPIHRNLARRGAKRSNRLRAQRSRQLLKIEIKNQISVNNRHSFSKIYSTTYQLILLKLWYFQKWRALACAKISIFFSIIAKKTAKKSDFLMQLQKIAKSCQFFENFAILLQKTAKKTLIFWKNLR